MKKVYQKKNKEYPKKNYKKFFTTPSYLTDKVFKLIIFPVAILAIFFTQREKKWFVNAQLNQCGDSVTNSYFDSYASKLECKRTFSWGFLNKLFPSGSSNLYSIGIFLVDNVIVRFGVCDLFDFEVKCCYFQILYIQDSQKGRKDPLH